jgi:hypothetical protein
MDKDRRKGNLWICKGVREFMDKKMRKGISWISKGVKGING